MEIDSVGTSVSRVPSSGYGRKRDRRQKRRQVVEIRPSIRRQKPNPLRLPPPTLSNLDHPRILRPGAPNHSPSSQKTLPALPSQIPHLLPKRSLPTHRSGPLWVLFSDPVGTVNFLAICGHGPLCAWSDGVRTRDDLGGGECHWRKLGERAGRCRWR